MRIILNLTAILLFSSFSAKSYSQTDSGYVYKVPEAYLSLKLPNEKWKLSNDDGNRKEGYFFKREPFIDSNGRKIIPAIMLFIEDATSFKKDVVLFSRVKRQSFLDKGATLDETLIQSDKKYPLQIKNGMFLRCSYKRNDIDHILYMVHIITKRDKGVQLYLDMTADIAEVCEPEFQVAMRSLTETND